MYSNVSIIAAIMRSINKGCFLTSLWCSMVLSYKVLWNKDYEKLNFKLGPQLIGAVISPVVLYACLMDVPFADTAIKLSAIWGLANGVFMALAPETAADGYGVEATPENKAGIKTMGFLVTGLCVFQALNAFTDMSPVQAFGTYFLSVAS